jgi:hypothetical protein
VRFDVSIVESFGYIARERLSPSQVLCPVFSSKSSDNITENIEMSLLIM